MGTKAETKALNDWVPLLLLGAVLVMVPPGSLAAETQVPATDRVIQFLTNAHTGVAMSDSEWLTTEARATGKISAHGGLRRLIEQSTAFSREYGGLKSVAVLEVKETGRDRQVLAEVKFVDDKRRKLSPSAAERENMIWKFIAKKEDGKWKLQF